MKKLAYFAMMAAVVAAFSFGSKAEARTHVSLNIGVGVPCGPVVAPCYPCYPAYPVVRPMMPPPPIIIHHGPHHHHHHCHPAPRPCPPPCPPRHHGGHSGAIHPRLR